MTKFQKERKRKEKKAAKIQERRERRSGGDAGSGPPIDYDATVGNLLEDLPPEETEGDEEQAGS